MQQSAQRSIAPFVYLRVIRFHETDAAGVLYFANLLTLCHEAYEASLAEAGVVLKQFFSKVGGVAVPVVHTSADFHRPLMCGDAITVTLTPKPLSPHSFEITYTVTAQLSSSQVGPVESGPVESGPMESGPLESGQKLRQLETTQLQKPMATAVTRHVCITTGEESGRPSRCPLTDDLVRWLALFGPSTAED